MIWGFHTNTCITVHYLSAICITAHLLLTLSRKINSYIPQSFQAQQCTKAIEQVNGVVTAFSMVKK